MDRMKFVFTNPLAMQAMLWTKLPLGAFAGLRVKRPELRTTSSTMPAIAASRNPSSTPQ